MMINITHKKNFVTYIIAIVLCVILLLLIYNIGEVDITKPLIYDGDGVSASYIMKTIDDTGWYLENPYVGGAYGGEFQDYVMSDSISLLLVKLISLFTNNVFLIYNLFYFLTYILVTVTCLYALNQLGIKKIIAVVCSLLYAFIPFHQLRIEHIWLEPYFMIPLVGLVSIWIVTEQIELKHNHMSNIIKDVWSNSKLKQAIIISFLVSSTGLYYAFFTCCIYALALLICVLKRDSKQQILFPVFFIFTTIVGVIFNVIPNVIYFIQNGTNAESELAIRSATESEIYGLKMIQLLLPRIGHRINSFNHIASTYANVSPLTNENSTVALGIIGSLGFVLLIFCVFNMKTKDKLINGLALLNLGTLLIATIGGVGAIFSYLIKTPMRCYNRISVLIAFFSLLFICIIISRFLEKHSKNNILRIIYYFGCVIMLAVGIYDQTVPYTSVEQKQNISEQSYDKEFIQMIEGSVPQGSMIYQLPHICFPSGSSYALFKGYINSNNLIWSYGSMQGRTQDEWEHSINELSIEEMTTKLSLAGYAGIYIDTALYQDISKLQETIIQLTDLLETQPIYRETGRLLFFNMEKYNEKLKDSFTDDAYENLKESVYNYISIEYAGEFSNLEKDSVGNIWRWCGSDGVIYLTNPTSEDMKINFLASVFMANGGSSISVDLNDNDPIVYNVNDGGTNIVLDIPLKPGKNTLLFHSDAPRLDITTDARELVFNIRDVRIEYK